MNKVISFSGGRTSAYLLNLFRNDPEAHFVFMDTGAEHPATYQFIKDIVKHWKIDLVCLRVVVNPVMNMGGTYKIIKIALAGKDEPEQFVKWVQTTEGSDVRSEGRKYNHHRMYRERLHASDIAEIYKDHSRDELYRSLRSSKRYESGSCTESCEAFGDVESVGGEA